MNKQQTLNQGEILLLLSNRTDFSKQFIAQALEIHPAHLSKIYKSEILSLKIKQKAAQLFNVDISIFDINNPVSEEYQVNEPSPEYVRNSGTAMGDLLDMIKEKERQHSEEMKKLYTILEKVSKSDK